MKKLREFFQSKPTERDETLDLFPLKQPVSTEWKVAGLDEPKKIDPELDPDPFQRTRTLPEDYELEEIVSEDRMTISMRAVKEEYRQFDFNEVGEWDKLIWIAASIKAVTGIQIDVRPGESRSCGVRNWDAYQIGAGRSTAFTFTFNDAWTYLNGMRHGAQAAQELKIDQSQT
jgi:hypothetical protein